MSNNIATQILDDLLQTLESRLGVQGDPAGSDPQQGRPRPDAITAELSRRPRSTAVVSLREAPEVEAFRQALTDGLIRVDTANRLLSFLNEMVMRMRP